MSLDILEYRKDTDPNSGVKRQLPKVSAGAMPTPPAPNPPAPPSSVSSVIGANENPILDMLEQAPEAPPVQLPQSDPSGLINPYTGDLSKMSIGDIQRLGIPSPIETTPDELPQSTGLPSVDYEGFEAGIKDNYEKEKAWIPDAIDAQLENAAPTFVYPDPTEFQGSFSQTGVDEWLQQSAPQLPETFEHNPFIFKGGTPFSSNVTASAIEQGGGMVTQTGKGLAFDQQLSWGAAFEDLQAVSETISPFGWVNSYRELFKGNWKGFIDKSPTKKLLKNIGGDQGSYGKGAIGSLIRSLDFIDNTARGAAADALGLKRIGDPKGAVSNLLRATAGGQDYSFFQVRDKGASPFATIPKDFNWKNPTHVIRGAGGFLADMALGTITGAIIVKPLKALSKAVSGTGKAATVAKVVTSTPRPLNPRIGEVVEQMKGKKAVLGTPVPRTPQAIAEALPGGGVKRIQRLAGSTPAVSQPVPVPKTLKQFEKYAEWKDRFTTDLRLKQQLEAIQQGKVANPSTVFDGIPLKQQPRKAAVKVVPEADGVIIRAPEAVPVEKAPVDIKVRTEPFPTLVKPNPPGSTAQALESVPVEQIAIQVAKESVSSGVPVPPEALEVLKDVGVQRRLLKAASDNGVIAVDKTGNIIETVELAAPNRADLAYQAGYVAGGTPNVSYFTRKDNIRDITYGAYKRGRVQGALDATDEALFNQPRPDRGELEFQTPTEPQPFKPQALPGGVDDPSKVVPFVPPGQALKQQYTQKRLAPKLTAIDGGSQGAPSTTGMKDAPVQMPTVEEPTGDSLGDLFNRADEIMSDPIYAETPQPILTPQELEVLSPVIKPQELTPQPTPSQAIEALRSDPDVFLDDITPVKRTNQQLTDLAVFMGHTKPRTTPLKGHQIKALEENYGSLYSKYGRGIDSGKLTHPAARIEVQPGNPVDGTPRVTRLKATALISEVVEKPATLKKLEEVLDRRQTILDNLDDEAKVVDLMKANDELANLGDIDYRKPEVMQELQERLPENLRTNTPEGHQATARLFEVEEAITDTTDEVRALQKELEDLDAVRELDEAEYSRYADSSPDGLEDELAYSREVWDMDEGVTPDYVPFKVNPDLYPDELEAMISQELPKFDWFHGTRIDDEAHDLRFINPDENTTLHELGTGVYFTTDVDSAQYYAKAQPSKNLPFDVQVSDSGRVSQVIPDIKGQTLVANLPPQQHVKDVFRDAAIKAGAHLDVVRSFMAKVGHAGNVDGLWDEFYETFRKMTGEFDAKLFHRFQVNVANGLRDSGYEAIVKLPDESGGEAVLNVLGRGGEGLPFQIGKTAPVDAPNIVDALAARASAEKIKKGTTATAKHLEVRSRLELNAQLRDVTQKRLDDAVDNAENLIDEQVLLERRLEDLAKQEKETSRRITQNIAADKQAEEMKYYHKLEDLNNPCLE